MKEYESKSGKSGVQEEEEKRMGEKSKLKQWRANGRTAETASSPVKALVGRSVSAGGSRKYVQAWFEPYRGCSQRSLLPSIGRSIPCAN